MFDLHQLQNGDFVGLKDGTTLVYVKFHEDDPNEEGVFFYNIKNSKKIEKLKSISSAINFSTVSEYYNSIAYIGRCRCTIQNIDIGQEHTKYYLDVIYDYEAFDKEQWVKEKLDEFHSNPWLIYMRTFDTIMVYDTHDARRNGFATCSPVDKFDLDTGVAIAYCRYAKLPIPAEILE
jgi:hypothetical protein